jgi:Predicted tRNA(5-methylaminomethyl-2-thiouridylate) methyltransferase, contains the PP-loop ATPase domain
MDKANGKIRVAVAVSGGVDSAAAAGLLKNSGFEVLGIFARLSGNKTEDEGRAKAVCEKLKIPFRVVDLRAEFKKESLINLLPTPKRIDAQSVRFLQRGN